MGQILILSLISALILINNFSQFCCYSNCEMNTEGRTLAKVGR